MSSLCLHHQHAAFPTKVIISEICFRSQQNKMAQIKEAKDNDKGLTWTHEETLTLIQVWSDTGIQGFRLPVSHFLAAEWIACSLRVNMEQDARRITLP